MAHFTFLFLVSSLIHNAAGFANGQQNENNTATFRIAGYLPDYRIDRFDFSAGRLLTDLILFSAQPTENGSLELGRLKNAPWPKLWEFKTQHRVRFVLCVGGWKRSGAFPAVVASPDTRARFVQSAVNLCIANRLDGLDLDWEHPKNADEQAGYARLLAELHDAFQPHGLALSVTIAAWQQLPPEAFDAADWIQVMAYDHEGQHATMDAAQADISSLLNRNVPSQKLVLGVPFYGRHIKERNQTVSYADIVAKHHPASGSDEVDGLYFNGPDTIRRKTKFAIESHLGGVMIWEIGQDARGDESLLNAIGGVVRP